MKRWHAICFDLDNTLFSHETAFQKAVCYCFKDLSDRWYKQGKISSVVDIDEWFTIFKSNCDKYWSLFEDKKVDSQTYRRLRYYETVTHMNLPYSCEEADYFQNHYYRVVDRFSEPYPELDSIFSLLKENSFETAIITNGSASTQYRKIKRLGIEMDIRSFFISEEVGLSKPNKEMFDYVKEQLELGSEHTLLYVGDSWEHDVVGSMNAGWDAVYLNTREQKPTTDHIPFATCSSLAEVKELIIVENHLKG
ncbi:HAD family hydrolase [Bacillus sp. FJAT-45350]|uniref:HAD family hydrolase n=1 Tax=Bacillus sp. FJAT-45350 TaxID=2011014 RepID=UPI000BB7C45D|nr:HAD family hydrolase [Bacillus sp. FJAT-45350]